MNWWNEIMRSAGTVEGEKGPRDNKITEQEDGEKERER